MALVFGIAVGVVSVQRQRHLEHPLLDLRMFGNRTFSSALTLMFVTAVVGTGTLLIVTLYLQNVTGLTPLAAGLLPPRGSFPRQVAELVPARDPPRTARRHPHQARG